MDLAILELAFTRLALDLIARSDGELHAAEAAVVADAAPDEALRAAGLLDAEGHFTARFETARREALERLPHELPLARRLDLLATCFRMVVADGDLDRAEGALLYDAARMLGVTAEQLEARLHDHDDIGEVDLDEPLDEA